MKRLLIIIGLFITATSLFAQFSVGFRQGISSHGIYLEPQSLTYNMVSYLLPNSGVVISYNNKMNAGLQLELNYAPKGWREEVDTLDNSFFQRTINYLEVPIFSHFEIGYGAVRPTIMFGPYFGFYLNESSDSNNYTHITTNHPNNHFYQPVKKIDFGIKIAVGLRYNINDNIGVFGEFRYDLEMAGGRDIFIDRPDEIQASRLKEAGFVFGVMWHIVPQEKKKEKTEYIPKQNLYE